MLTSFRELLRSKWAGGILFGLVIMAMALWIDDPASFLGGSSGKAVKAGERGFTIQEFDQQVEQFLFRQRAEGGLTTRIEAVESGAVDQLFNFEASRMARLGYAESIGAGATLGSALENVRATAAFQDPLTGEFSVDEYRRMLRNNQLTPEGYEQDLRDSLTLDLMSRAINAALIAPPVYQDLQATYIAKARTLSWFTVTADMAGPPPEPTEEALQAFYDERQQAFSIPERRSFSVLTLSPSDFVHQVEVAPEDLRAIYESQRAQRFSEPESRRFVEVAASSEAAARAALGRLAGGAASEDLEADTGIVSVTLREGRRQEFPDNDMNNLLFDPNARPGMIVGPEALSGVWLVMRLEDVIPGAPIPFEDVSELIRDELAESEAQSLFLQAEAGLFDQIGAGLTLEEIGREIGAPILTYAPLSQSARLESGRVIPGLAQRPEVMSTVFDSMVDIVSDPVENEQDVVLIEVQEIVAPRTPALDEIRDNVLAAYTQNADSERLTNFGLELASRAETEGVSMAELASGLGVELQSTPRPISRSNIQSATAPPNALASAFGANEGDVFSAAGPAPGELTIMRVDSIVEPSPEDVEILGQVVSAQLTQSLQNDILQALETEFRNSVGFEADRRALDLYKQQILDQQQ
ncbi:MAG: peptidyl-prolyl cis-trans isomerase [Pseudomonadota bacterium]